MLTFFSNVCCMIRVDYSSGMGILSHPLGLPLLLHSIDKYVDERTRVAELGYMVINGNIKHLDSSLKNLSNDFKSLFPDGVYDASNADKRIANPLIFKTLFDQVDVIDNYLAAKKETRASIKHDMNLPISSKFFDQYDLVVDSGTLEHIFNFPQALMNIANILKVGGVAYHYLPACSWLEHGFTQFSAEALMSWYKVNGYDIKHAYYSMQDKDIDYYSDKSLNHENFKVLNLLSKEADKEEFINLKNRASNSVVDVVLVAKKVSEVGSFSFPQQGFWSDAWKRFS